MKHETGKPYFVGPTTVSFLHIFILFNQNYIIIFLQTPCRIANSVQMFDAILNWALGELEH